MQFRRAEKTRARLRLALVGPAGSGKSFSSLVLAQPLAEGGRIAVLDTERGSASLYADLFEFDVLELDSFEPQTYVEAIHAAEREGYRVIVIDSLSHAWEGKGGALDQKEAAEKKQRTPNSYTAWREITPIHNALVDAMLQSPAHVIATMRAKTEYVQERGADGKTTIRKVGMKPVQRDGMDFEFTIVGDLDWDHNLIITKSRIPSLADQLINRPGPQLGETILRWLNSGAEPQERPAAPQDVPDARPAASAPARQTTSAQQSPASGQRNGNGPIRQAPPLSQAQAVAAASEPDLPAKEFIERADAMAFTLPGGGHDYVRIVAALGMTPPAEQKAAGAQLADWAKQPGNSYRAALVSLRKSIEQATASPPANSPATEAEPPFDACRRCGKTDAWREGVCTACGYTAEDDAPACTTCGAVGGLTDEGCTFCGEKPATDVKPVQVEAEQPALAGMTAS